MKKKKKKEKKDRRITLIIDLELYKVDEDDVNELVSLVSLYSDDFLYDIFKNDGNILNWDIKAEINRD